MQTMHKKALTVAIAGALAAPMAAQAVDFTISGHVNRALFVVDKDGDGGTKAQVANNGGSSTRVRVTGSTELDEGMTVGIQWEYQDNGSGGLGLRHANVQLGSSFGKLTIGQGSEAGDGSQYSDTTGVFGIGHGAGTSSDFSLGSYFGSLDGGGRVEMVRYDTPALGPMSAAVSVANGDRVSGQIAFKSEFAGTSVGAKLATLQFPAEKAMDRDRSSIGASIGATMPSGLTLSGAWAKGKDMSGSGPVAATPGSVAEFGDRRYGCINPSTQLVVVPAIDGNAFGATECTALNSAYVMSYGYSLSKAAVAATPGSDAAWTDPSYYQVEIGYKFGNSGVAVSWYSSDDFVTEDSEGTAIGLGFRHTLPKANAELYAAAQKYDVTRGGTQAAGVLKEEDETVFVVGTRVKF